MTDPTASFRRTTLGRTGLEVGRLGLAAGYGVPTRAVERAFEAGVNYLYWGSVRRDAFADALRHLASQREHMVLVVQSYSRWGWWVTGSVERALKKLGFEYADVLLLGMWNGPAWSGVLDAGRRLKERGLVRHLGLSTHQRSVVPKLATNADIELFHVRYNAVHRGAERDIFPHLPADSRPGLVAFTTTSWRQLLDPRRVPPGERVPTAGDCYRFVLSQPTIDVCMTGPSSLEHMEHALEAFGQGPMSEDELAWMRRVGAAIYAKKRGRPSPDGA
jgi:aryl-alcohol dehydrogenase-like predicted oxidoreductase